MKKETKPIRSCQNFLYNPYIKGEKKYLDISKWTTIMSRRHARHFYVVFDESSKVITIMRAYMVPPFGIRWEERRKDYFKIFKGFPSWYAINVNRKQYSSYYWKCLIIPINAILGKCPGLTPAMNLYRKEYSSYYWPPSILKFGQNWVLCRDFII